MSRNQHTEHTQSTRRAHAEHSQSTRRSAHAVSSVDKNAVPRVVPIVSNTMTFLGGVSSSRSLFQQHHFYLVGVLPCAILWAVSSRGHSSCRPFSPFLGRLGFSIPTTLVRCLPIFIECYWLSRFPLIIFLQKKKVLRTCMALHCLLWFPKMSGDIFSSRAACALSRVYVGPSVLH